jgi:hypothetical protein
MTYFNRKTKITASVLSALLGLSGVINHGLFEVLQGHKPTNGFFIEAIGETNRFWIHGTEAAFTIVHNYLITGILAMLTGLAIVVWSLKFLDRKYGPTVLISLFILLTLVGGGIGFIILYLPTWAFATRINKSLDWWRKLLPEGFIKILSSIWIYSLAAAVICWLIVMELGIFGYFPGQSKPDTILSIVFIFLFSTVALACITFICAIASDIEERNHYQM